MQECYEKIEKKQCVWISSFWAVIITILKRTSDKSLWDELKS
jgi:hypothetical protein